VGKHTIPTEAAPLVDAFGTPIRLDDFVAELDKCKEGTYRCGHVVGLYANVGMVAHRTETTTRIVRAERLEVRT
jgi:hypothetical protein